jgi:hypothetical protein
MKCLAAYPMSAEDIQPHIGKTVIGLTHHGDTFCGRIERVEDGNVYFTFEGTPSADVASAVQNHPSVRRSKRRSQNRAETKAFWPYYGLGLGWAFFIPLILLAALFAW